MSDKNNKIEATVTALMQGVDKYITSKTVVGDVITVGSTIILPLVDVSFAIGAGAFASDQDKDAKDRGAGGMGAKMSPCALLVINNGTTKLVNVRNQDGLTKILDMIPDLVDKFTADMGTGKKAKKETVKVNDVEVEVEDLN